jgi:hypothetical protein
MDGLTGNDPKPFPFSETIPPEQALGSLRARRCDFNVRCDLYVAREVDDPKASRET